MIRVLLVDDHAVVRAGLRLILESQADIEVVGEAASGEEALVAVQDHQPDVVLLDLVMGDGLDGIATTKRLRARFPAVQVLIFTTYDADSDIVRTIDAGAIGYVLKSSQPDEIFRAIRAAQRGDSTLSPPVASTIMRQLQNPQDSLTPREAEILDYLSQGLSNKELAQKLFISETTVKTHLAHIYAKLGAEGRGSAIAIATKRGLVRPR